MLKKILAAVVVLVVAFLGFVATRPATSHYERSTTIAAAPDAVFPWLNDHKRFVQWSPWEKRDPNQKATFSGPEQGVGAKYHWVGNDEVGEGTMVIVESKPNEMVKEDLHFLKPFESKSVVSYTLAPDNGGTKVTWAMDGDNDFAAKLFGVFVDMDEMLGKDFDDGLASLKRLVEAAPAAAPPPAVDAVPEGGADGAAVAAADGAETTL